MTYTELHNYKGLILKQIAKKEALKKKKLNIKG